MVKKWRGNCLNESLPSTSMQRSLGNQCSQDLTEEFSNICNQNCHHRCEHWHTCSFYIDRIQRTDLDEPDSLGSLVAANNNYNHHWCLIAGRKSGIYIIVFPQYTDYILCTKRIFFGIKPFLVNSIIWRPEAEIRSFKASLLKFCKFDCPKLGSFFLVPIWYSKNSGKVSEELKIRTSVHERPLVSQELHCKIG